MIIIADSGSTKTTWRLINPVTSVQEEIQTAGINPFYQDEKAITNTLLEEFHVQKSNCTHLYFYGAGCANEAVNQVVKNSLQLFFEADYIEVQSDLMAAARALCQDRPGIACILGTGSNSCYYNGTDIGDQVSPLGFILGDEASGAVLGKKLLSDVLKKQLPDNIIANFWKSYPITPAEIMDNIYRKPFPNRYAATFTHFIFKNINDEAMQLLVRSEFLNFFKRNVLQYQMANKLPVHFTGSIAFHFQEILKETATSLGLQTGEITRAPIEELIKYHINHLK